MKDTAYENRYHLGLLPVLSLKVRVGEFIKGYNAFVDEDSIRCHHVRIVCVRLEFQELKCLKSSVTAHREGWSSIKWCD